MKTAITSHEFSLVTTEDIPCIKAHLKCANYEESNHNLVNMFMWQNWFPLWKYESDHYLLLLGLHNGQFFIYMPLCAREYFDEALMSAKSLFDRYDLPMVMSCFTKEAMNRAQTLIADLEIYEDRSSADYVYSHELLMTLSGKKLQKRRNHYNAFVKEYGERCTYIEMDEDNALSCLAFLHNWKEENEDPFLHYEKMGTAFILNHFGLFDAKGLIIKIDGEVQAFMVGSQLSERMVQLNIEKANTAFRGLYQALEKEFLSRFYLDLDYVNKEDDIGSEAIRHAKLAYYPEYLIEKYRITIQEGQHDQTSAGQG